MTRRNITDQIPATQEEPVRGASVENVHCREQLILEHLAQVKQVALRIRKRLPAWVSLDDLQAAGALGLLAAVDRYAPEHQATLQTFAEHKIRSSILDSLRRLDWASRSQRKRVRWLERATAVLEQRHQRPPTEEELAAEIGITVAQYRLWRSASAGLTPESLDTVAAGDERDSPVQFVTDSEEHWPSHLAERAEQAQLLRKAIETRPDREQTILHLYYYEELTLAEIAKVMNLHESRISQLKSRAVQQLRFHLQPQKTGHGSKHG